MARRGVWELQEILLRYSPDAGSSRGVRDFVEQDLVRFARENPHVKIVTTLRNMHPNVSGRYITGYVRQLDLRNHDRESVASRFQYLRDSVGHKLPTHNKVGMGVVDRQRVSIQGVWHNTPALVPPLHPEEVELRRRRHNEYALPSLVREVGLAGVLQISLDLLDAQKEAKERALAKLPKVQRVLPTE